MQKEAVNTEKKAERTRKNIHKAFCRLADKKSIDKISVKELCDAAAITRSTFYQYYSSMEELTGSMEEALLSELENKLSAIQISPRPFIPAAFFVEKFDYTPPELFQIWLSFCQKHKAALTALIHVSHGDPMFIEELKELLKVHLNAMMDSDGQAEDELRGYFVNMLLEVHLMAARALSETDNGLIHLLNSVRVGGCYISFKEKSDPDFSRKMKLTGEV